MTTSTNEKKPAQSGGLFAALARAAAECQAVHKDAANTFHRYKYASAENIYDEARGPLAAHGITLVPVATTLGGSAETGYRVELGYLLVHASGESLAISRTWPVIPDKGRPLDKALAAALTTCLAYLVRDLLLLPRVDEEVDQREDRRESRREDVRHVEAPAPKVEAAPTTKQKQQQTAGGESAKAKLKVKALRLRAPQEWHEQIDRDLAGAGDDVEALNGIAEALAASLPKGVA